MSPLDQEVCLCYNGCVNCSHSVAGSKWAWWADSVSGAPGNVFVLSVLCELLTLCCRWADSVSGAPGNVLVLSVLCELFTLCCRFWMSTMSRFCVWSTRKCVCAITVVWTVNTVLRVSRFCVCSTRKCVCVISVVRTVHTVLQVLNEHDEQILCLEHGLRHVQRKRHVKAAKLFYRYTEVSNSTSFCCHCLPSFSSAIAILNWQPFQQG